MIYLDHAATAPPRRSSIEAMWPYMTQVFANPSSSHAMGREAKAGLDLARSQVGEVFGCRPGEVIFTSGGTESNNLALQGIANAEPRGKHLVVSAIEHQAVLETARWMQSQGFELDVIGVDRFGLVDLDDLQSKLRPDTTLCSIMYANNEIGTVQPIAEISKVCRSAGVPLHVDAVQAPSLLPLDVTALGIDAMSISAHKFGGPRGSGALFLAGTTVIEAVNHGGGQERGRRSGTSDVAGAVGMATALKEADSERVENVIRETALRDRLIAGVLETTNAILTGHPQLRLANHASFCFPGLFGEAILQGLETVGIICSSGSACSADSEEASEVLLAIGLGEAKARTAVRFTLGPETSSADIDAVLDSLPKVLSAVESLS